MQTRRMHAARAPAALAGRAAFTMLEMAIAAAVLVVLGGSLITALGGMRSLTTTGGTDSKLQEGGQRVLRTIIADLRRTGPLPGGYPVVFDNANPPPGFGQHVHAATAKTAGPGDPDFGADRDLIFLLPQDADGDGRPDQASDGTLIWAAEEISFVAVPAGDGTNQIERRVDGAFDRRLAGNVELLRFDDFGSSLGAVPPGCVRVRLSLRDRDDDGVLHRYFVETTIQLRNGS